MVKTKIAAFLLFSILAFSLPMFAQDAPPHYHFSKDGRWHKATMASPGTIKDFDPLLPPINSYSLYSAELVQSNFTYCQTHTCTTAMGIGGVVRISVGEDFTTFVVLSGGVVYRLMSGSWVSFTTGMTDAAVVNATHAYFLGATSGSSNVYFYNGSTLTLFGNKIFTGISASTLDGTFGGVDSAGVVWMWNTTTGAYDKEVLPGYELVSGRGKLAIVDHAIYWGLHTGNNGIMFCKFQTSCTGLYGAATEITASGLNKVWVMNGTIQVFTGSVENILACSVSCFTSLHDTATAMGSSGAELFVADATGQVGHLNTTSLSVVSSSFANVNNIPAVCLPDNRIVAWAEADYGGLDCPQDHISAPVGVPPVQITGTASVTLPSCDLFTGPQDSPCDTRHSRVYVSCYVNPVYLAGPQTPSTCRDNPVPRDIYSWQTTGTVNVYIDSTYWAHASNNYNLICAGTSVWQAADGLAYVCHSSTGPPPTTTVAPYIYITQLTAAQLAKGVLSHADPNGTTTADGMHPYDFRTASKTAHGFQIHVGEIFLEPGVATGQYGGLLAHENGHFHFLGNCPLPMCQINTVANPSSTMGGQSTLSPSQPTAPTPCDLYWYGQYLAMLI